MFGGKSDPGETPEHTVIRELEEEVSIKLDPNQLNFFTKVKSEKQHQFEYLFWAAWRGNIDKLTYDQQEVAAIGWYDIDLVLKNLSEGVDGWYCYGEGELATIREARTKVS